jgi:hypothetical protein
MSTTELRSAGLEPTVVPPAPRREASESRYLYAGLSVAAIWLAVAAASIWSPDLVSNAEGDRVPIAAFTDWFYAVIATGLVLLAFARRTRGAGPSLWAGFTLAVAGIWLVVAAASIWAPDLIAGAEDDHVPVAALASPIAGVLATAFAAVFVAGSQAGTRAIENG